MKLSDLTCALLRQQGHLGTQFPSACQKKSGIQRTIVWSRLWKSQALNRTGVATMPAYKGMTVRLCYVTESGARRVHGLPRQALLPVSRVGRHVPSPPQLNRQQPSLQPSLKIKAVEFCKQFCHC